MIYYAIFVVAIISYVVFLYKGKYIISSASLFILFNCLYCYGLLIAYYFYSGTIKVPLLEEKNYIDLVSLTALLGMVSFSFCYSFRNDNRANDSIILSQYYHINTFLTVIVLFFLSIPLILLGPQYGWHAITHERTVEVSAATTIYAYLRYAFIVLSLLLLSLKFSKKSVVAYVFIINIVVMLFDGARTTFLGLALGYLFILHRSGVRLGLKSNLLILFLMFMIPTARALALSSDFVSSIIASFAAESTMGGYTSLQGVEATKNGGLLFGMSYFLDPIIYLLPRALRDGNLFFFNHVSSNLYGEEFAPMGGFYYIAEAYSNFSVLGGAVVGGVFAIVLRFAENSRIRGYFFGLVFISTFGATFTKVYFANEIKIFVVFYIFALLWKSLFLKRLRQRNDN